MSLFNKFKIGLGKSSSGLTDGFKNIFSKKNIDDEVLTKFEELIISSDAGVEVAKELRKDFENLKINKKLDDHKEILKLIAEKMAIDLLKYEKDLSLMGNAKSSIIVVSGVNGAGKTTSFYMIVGLIKPLSGHIYLEDTDITKFPMYKRAQSGIGYLAQEASVFRKLTVEQNIKSVLELTKLSKQEQHDRTEALLEEFGLNHIRKNRGDLLSGGERRRTEIARALATDPKFVLLDEPFAGVGPVAVEDIQKIVAHLKKRNIGILITDHNVQETLAITDRTYLMFEGKILKTGTPEELAQDEMVRKVYLGQNFELRKKKLTL